MMGQKLALFQHSCLQLELEERLSTLISAKKAPLCMGKENMHSRFSRQHPSRNSECGTKFSRASTSGKEPLQAMLLTI